MGYTIHYSPESNERYPTNGRTKVTKRIILMMLAAIALFFAVKYRTTIARFLLPGDPDVTADALKVLVEDIRDGDTGGALAAFCREIVNHAAG